MKTANKTGVGRQRGRRAGRPLGPRNKAPRGGAQTGSQTRQRSPAPPQEGTVAGMSAMFVGREVFSHSNCARRTRPPTATLETQHLDPRKSPPAARAPLRLRARGSPAPSGPPARGAAPPHGGRRSVWYLAGARGGLEDARNGGGGGGQGGAGAAVAGRTLERQRRPRVSRRCWHEEEAVALPAVAGVDGGDRARLSQDRGPRRALRPQVSGARPGGRSRPRGAPREEDSQARSWRRAGRSAGPGRAAREGVRAAPRPGRLCLGPSPAARPSAAPRPSPPLPGPARGGEPARPRPRLPGPGRPAPGVGPSRPGEGGEGPPRRPARPPRAWEAGLAGGGARRSRRPGAGLCCEGSRGLRPTWRRSAECGQWPALPSGPSPHRPGGRTGRLSRPWPPLPAPDPGSCRPRLRCVLSRSGLRFHCAVGRMQPPPLFMSLERRSRERFAREAPAFYCKRWFS